MNLCHNCDILSKWDWEMVGSTIRRMLSLVDTDCYVSFLIDEHSWKIGE